MWALLPAIIKGEYWNILYFLEGNNVFVLCRKVSVHLCGCYIRFLQLSCMVVMILMVIWASCDCIPSHVIDILLLGLSSYNLVRVQFHDLVRSGYSSSNSISRSVLLIHSFGSSRSCHQGGAVMNPSFLSVSVGPSPIHY